VPSRRKRKSGRPTPWFKKPVSAPFRRPRARVEMDTARLGGLLQACISRDRWGYGAETRRGLQRLHGALALTSSPRPARRAVPSSQQASRPADEHAEWSSDPSRGGVAALGLLVLVPLFPVECCEGRPTPIRNRSGLRLTDVKLARV